MILSTRRRKRRWKFNGRTRLRTKMRKRKNWLLDKDEPKERT